MHAANFGNIIGALSPADWRHATFEILADKEHEKHRLDPQSIQVEEIKGLMRDNLDAVIFDTARFAKNVFTRYVKPRLDAKVRWQTTSDGPVLVIDNHWTVEETADAFREAFTYGQKATAAFLATWSGLTGFQTAPYTQPDTNCALAPSFVEWNGHGYMLWGHSDDSFKYQVYYARFDPVTDKFVQPRYVFNADPAVDELYKTYETPATAVLGGVLYVAWHRRGTNELYFSYWQGGDEVEQAGNQWSPARKISDQAHIKDYTAPVLVVYKKRLFAIWADNGYNAPGEGDRDGIWYSYYNPATGGWTRMTKIPGVDTRQTPTATVFNDRIFAAWPGYHGGEPLFMASYDWEHNWTSQTRMPDDVASSEAPSLTVANGALHLFWRRDSDRKIVFTKSMDGNSWHDKETIEVSDHRGVGAAAFGNWLFVGWNEDWRVRYLFRAIKS